MGWARDNYDMGVRYIGGCCGYQPYHIRAVAEELEKERGIVAPGSDKHEKWGKGLEMHTKPWVRARATNTGLTSNHRPAAHFLHQCRCLMPGVSQLATKH